MVTGTVWVANVGHGDSQGMPGMMDDETEMTTLEQADGGTLMYQTMIEHHEVAIEMARTEQANGENPDAAALAEQIETDQKSEIAKMDELLGS